MQNNQPSVSESAWIAPTATLLGLVTIGAESSVWYSAVLRADTDEIRIGSRSNIQDGCILHVDEGKPLIVGDGVSVGHRAILHGCVVEDDCLIGMGAILLNGSSIGRGSLVAAGALVTEGAQFPANSVIMGSPATVRRDVDGALAERIRRNAAHYVGLASRYRVESAT